jgi:hypothetical protein
VDQWTLLTDDRGPIWALEESLIVEVDIEGRLVDCGEVKLPYRGYLDYLRHSKCKEG